MSYIATILSLFVIACLIQDTKCHIKKPVKQVKQVKQVSQMTTLSTQIEKFIRTKGRDLTPTSLEGFYDICHIILTPREFGGLGCTSEHDLNGYYTDEDDCYKHFVNVFPSSDINEPISIGNTSICRIFYTAVADYAMKNKINNIDHTRYCVYIGKTGGNKCTDE